MFQIEAEQNFQTMSVTMDSVTGHDILASFAINVKSYSSYQQNLCQLIYKYHQQSVV